MIAFFLVVAGTNYALMFFALARRRPQAFGRDEEFRLYLALIGIAAVILIELLQADIAAGEEAIGIMRSSSRRRSSRRRGSRPTTSTGRTRRGDRSSR